MRSACCWCGEWLERPILYEAGLSHMTFQNPMWATLESKRVSEGNFRIQLSPLGQEKNRKIPYAIPLLHEGTIKNRAAREVCSVFFMSGAKQHPPVAT